MIHAYRMKALLLQAPYNFTKRMPKGFILQVVTQNSWNCPTIEEVKAAMRRMGLEKEDLAWASPTNWKIAEIKI